MTESETPAHLQPKITDRGFKHMPEIPGTYDATSVRVYESSAAAGPHIWLAAQGRNATDGIHLTLESAAHLWEQLEYLINNHYQNV
jgi:hypothetical protein